MSAPSVQRDPRSVITPDAFDVSGDLLGLPLAPPRKRLAAMLVDLLFIAFITLLTKSFALVLGVVAAVFFVRVGFKRTPVRGSVFGRAMRVSVGCLGLVIGLVTAVLWAAFGVDFGGDGGGPNVTISVDPQDLVATAITGEPEGPVEVRDVGAVEDEVSLYSIDEALEAYATLLRSTRAGEMDVARRSALEARLVAEIAADSLVELERRIGELQQEVRDREASLDATRAALEDASSGGLFGWIRSSVDELGFGFGWASLYLTVMLSWWNGQTVGKRLLGIRVLRLDGQAITWWVAFERAGGYAAGFATGLLGFAQVYWDANRQAIHDRIVGTVVVLEGAEPVPDWESAL